MVVLEQTAEPFVSDDFASALIFRAIDELVAYSLVRTLQIGMGDELVDRSLE